MDRENKKILLENRYELIEKIGSGGMAHVYKAKCHRLNRFVAVKILKSEHTTNADFIKKFNDEAKSAASLTHPNIVSVYDVGCENDIHFIVMEYIDGITLKELIEKKRTLKWKDAMIITKQIVSAIEAAHKLHIVHRDIKPHNIMMTRDGVAKVTDFGIAKAVSDSTIQVSESNMGSVHYLSPEQARGGYVDDRSDLYSIGITLYEMLTGTVPFDGDSSVSVAMKHINETIIPPIEINKNIPVGVNDFVVKATRKDPRQRYQTATEMLADIAVVILSPHTHLMSADENQNSSMNSINSNYSPGGPRKFDKPKKTVNNKPSRIDSIDVGNFAKNTIAIVTSLLISIVILVISASVLLNRIDILNEKEYSVESFVGMNVNEIEKALRAKGFEVTREYVPDDKVEPFTILSQQPEAGIVKKGAKFTFIVSSAVDNYPVKNYRNNTDLRLINEDFKGTDVEIKVVEMYSETVEKGRIIGTRPGENEFVKKGDTLIVYRSKGKMFLDMPLTDFSGKTEEEARAILETLGLNVIVKPYIEPESEEEPIDEVPFTNTHEEQEENQESPGDFTPEPSYPNTGVETNPSDENSSEPTPTPTETPDPTLDPNYGKVVAQYPKAGTKVMSGDTVILYMSPIERYRQKVDIVLNYEEDMNISEYFTVKIDVLPNDATRIETIYDGIMHISELPNVFEIDVPSYGHAQVTIYINANLYCKYFLEGPGIKK